MRTVQVKQFKDCEENEINEFLQSIYPKDLIGIEYSSINQKGWSREGIDHNEEAYETSKNVTNVLVVYWKTIDSKKSGEPKK